MTRCCSRWPSCARDGSGGAPLPLEPEGDLELIEVFLEEAAEILAGMETSISGWIERARGERVAHRAAAGLHTLKGGARMAGFIAIGNLSTTSRRC